MRAVWMVASSAMVRHRVRVVLLTMLAGLLGAVVLATVAGARRTSSALDRFATWSRTAQLEILVGDASAAQLHAFARVPGVRAFAPLRGGAVNFPSAPNLQSVAEAYDTRFGTTVDRPRVVAGRLANPRAANEVDVGEALASAAHLSVGARLVGLWYTPAQIQSLLSGGPVPTRPAGPRITARVVGIVRRPLDLGDRGASGGVLVFTPAFTHRYLATTGTFNGTILRVRTRAAGDTASVEAAARRIFGRSPQFYVQDLSVDTQGAQSAIDVLASALWIFAAVAVVAGTIVLAIIVNRELSGRTVDQATERALGLTRTQRVAAGFAEMVPIVVGGTVLAAVGAALLSPRFPIGIARRAEPDPGFHLDATVLGLGALAFAVLLAVIALAAATLATRTETDPSTSTSRTGRAIEAASRAGAGVPLTTGVRMALQRGRGPRSVPVRSAVFGAVVGVVGIVVALVFVASLDHLEATPRLSGWTWDLTTVPDTPQAAGRQSAVMRTPGIDAVALVRTGNVEVAGRAVIGWGYIDYRGKVGPQIIAGRAPAHRDEVALGAATLAELHRRIGELVHAVGPDGTGTYRIVGRTVFPHLDSPQPLANGATFTGAGLDALVNPKDPTNGNAYLMVRVRQSSDRSAVARRLATTPSLERPFAFTLPVEVGRLVRVRWLPIALAALLATLALVAVTHALFSSVRRRRRDFAVLETLGFDTGQVRATVAWHATTLAITGLLIGVPVGIVTATYTWNAVARGLGVAPGPTVPVIAIIATAAAVLVAVNVVARVPARRAAAASPASVLRTE